MTTLLRYDLTTDPFPLQASPASGNLTVATLTVVASNPNADPVKNPVTLQGLSVTLPVGTDADDLTPDATTIGPVAPSNWTLQDPKKGDGFIEYLFYPEEGHEAVGKEGLPFVFNNVQVNRQPGTAEVTVKEGSAGNPTQSLYVTKFPAGWGEVSFWVDPTDVPQGGTTTLHWSGPEGATYTIEYFDWQMGRVVNVPGQGEPALSNAGQYPGLSDPPLRLIQTTDFTLNVVGEIEDHQYHAQEQKTVTVEVGPPQIKSFTASPIFDAPASGATVLLSWETENVSQFHIDDVGTFDGPDALNGSHPYSPGGPGPCCATAYGLEGYSGPPAPAETRVGLPGSAASGFLMMWVDSLQPAPLWTLSTGPGENVFVVASSVNSTDDSSGHEQDFTGTLQLAQGLQAAFLGTGRGGTSYDALLNATYQAATTLAEIWSGYRLNLSDDIFDEEPSNLGYTWGVKFPDGRLALVWYQNAAPDGDYYGTHSWAFTFQWIDYGKPSA